MIIRTVTTNDAESLAQYYQSNASHLHQWEPKRDLNYHDKSNWTKRLKQIELDQKNKSTFHFVSIDENSNKIIAACSLTGISYGVFMAGYMGFSVSRDYQGKCEMRKLCIHVIDFAFNHLKLNRIMANYMPDNVRSENLLLSLKFEKEGLAKDYLRINGEWQDHVLTSLLNINS